MKLLLYEEVAELAVGQFTDAIANSRCVTEPAPPTSPSMGNGRRRTRPRSTRGKVDNLEA